MKTLTLISLAAVATVGACASRASGVAPVPVSATEYYELTCDDTRAELNLAREREAAFTRKQNNAATADAVGVFLVLIPAGSLVGGSAEGELALAKGEVRALERAVERNCTRETNADLATEAANAEIDAAKAEAAAATAEADAAKAEAAAAIAEAESLKAEMESIEVSSEEQP